MRKRVRHFNPRFAGAGLVLDSRYINQSDNTSVSSWADRSGNNHTIDQQASASQPTFRTAQQGGNGSVSFDGSNDFLVGGDILDAGQNDVLLLTLSSITNSSAGIAGKQRSANAGGRYGLIRQSGPDVSVWEESSYLGASYPFGTGSSTIIRTGFIKRSSFNRLYNDGVQLASTTVPSNSTNWNTSDIFMIGALQSSSGGTPPLGGFYLNGSISCVIVLIGSIEQSTRTLIERTLAFAFKIKCS